MEIPQGPGPTRSLPSDGRSGVRVPPAREDQNKRCVATKTSDPLSGPEKTSLRKRPLRPGRKKRSEASLRVPLRTTALNHRSTISSMSVALKVGGAQTRVFPWLGSVHLSRGRVAAAHEPSQGLEV